MEKLDCKVGFLGGGKMAQAMAQGFMSGGLIDGCNFMASARTDRTLSIWQKMGASTTRDNFRLVQECDIVFLAVKPYLLPGVLEEIKGAASPEQHLFVSVAAGVPLQFMEEALPKGCRVIRTIPNTPCEVRAGVVAYTPGRFCRDSDGRLIKRLLSSTGVAELVPEQQIDIVSSICGSQVAWFYSVIDAAADGAVKCGMPRETAIRLVASTMIGAGKMVLETGLHPGQLKDNVCSPAGSTIVGLHKIEEGGVRATFINAVEAAFLRNKEFAPK